MVQVINLLHNRFIYTTRSSRMFEFVLNLVLTLIQDMYENYYEILRNLVH